MSLRITIATSNGWYKIFETPTYKANKARRESITDTRRLLKEATSELEETKNRLALLEEQNQPVTGPTEENSSSEEDGHYQLHRPHEQQQRHTA